MKKTTLLFSAALLLTACGGTEDSNEPELSLESTQIVNSDETDQDTENTVTYTDSGYSPATLTIEAGETVTFQNDSASAMWTASAVHPTHGEYPTDGGCLGSTFDSCEGTQPGESWSFQFDETGEWGYHNHLAPSDTGKIVVE